MKIWASCGRVEVGAFAAHREGRFAVVVGLRQVLERRALVAGGLLVVNAELVAGKARPVLGRRHQHIAFELEAGGRRAIEEMAVDLKFCRRIP